MDVCGGFISLFTFLIFFLFLKSIVCSKKKRKSFPSFPLFSPSFFFFFFSFFLCQVLVYLLEELKKSPEALVHRPRDSTTCLPVPEDKSRPIHLRYDESLVNQCVKFFFSRNERSVGHLEE